ncbi:hypothetical protein F2P56_015805 [Juglans regia]|uniref:UspA domain-containing protein n=2 Tax=Juglans regia TaxID=51240 RepID=A0A834CQ21_JUGRE|nr:uncharacterized protein LOC109008696 [Juglans regia]KAF5465835.1 hypothetical protein F2P56_015805 [Juglans regia]
MQGGGTPPTRKVMVIAEPTRESAIALQYTLSHAIFEQDELILLHVGKYPSSRPNAFSTFMRRPKVGSSSAIAFSDVGGGNVDFLEEMKHACKIAQPKLLVSVKRVEIEGKNKARVILFQSKMLNIDLIFVGQRRSLSSSILGCRRPGGSMRAAKVVDTAEYLIENSNCNCVGVQKKGQNAGYLLNTKTHKNFWLLA